jgi:stage II sporulation protein D
MRILRKLSSSSTRRSRRRWLASLVAAATACAHPAPTPSPTTSIAAEPELRIGLSEQSSVALGGDGELFLTDDGNGQLIGSIPVGARWSVVPDSGGPGVRVVQPDGSLSEPHPGVFAVNVSEGRFAVAQGKPYRGRLSVVRSGSGVLLVNRVPIESYVASVIGSEMGARRPNEQAALLAQAIVSRTYVLKNRGRWETQGVDAFADTRDQVYGGVATEEPQAVEAARATAGMVLKYHGDLIDAFFHSTCGQKTAAVEEVFKGATPQPYLRPVSDAKPGGGYYCDISPRFQWREEWDLAKLRAILSRTLPAVTDVGRGGLQPITDIQISQTTPSGRVGELRIVFERSDVRIAGPDVRRVLRPESGRMLNSQAFTLTVTRANGRVTRVVAEGTGSGHGVGFCQWGALGRAQAGQNYQTILSTYFPGTTVARQY